MKVRETVKTSKTKCSEEDEFDFELGSKLAIERLFNPNDEEIRGCMNFGFRDTSFQSSTCNIGVEDKLNAIMDLIQSIPMPKEIVLLMITEALTHEEAKEITDA